MRAATLLAVLALSAALPAAAAVEAPEELDCTRLPCHEVMPGAARFEPVEGRSYWAGFGADGEKLGWVALSTRFVDVKAYSGKPLVTLVGLDRQGLITGARVVHHGEPILLVGIPEQALHDFARFYAGKSPLQRIVVGRADKPDVLSVDGISGATVTVLAQNMTILETARALGTRTGVFAATTERPGHFVEEAPAWSFQRALEEGAIGRLVVSQEEMGIEGETAPFVDLYFGIADAPQVGEALLGARNYAHYRSKLQEDEHLLVIFNAGTESFKGSAFVRGGIFDRVRLQQGVREITFRDTDYWNLSDPAAPDAPTMREGGLFVLRGGRFDPGAEYELVFLGSRYDHRSAFSREFREFTAAHHLPESIYVVEEVATGLPWREAWRQRRLEVTLVLVYLLGVIGVFVLRNYTTVDSRRLERLHLASLVLGFLVLGVALGAQPSVTQLLTAAGSVVGEWRWDLFLSEPLIFVSWIFIAGVSLVWGRGVFCGWVCPYGAMNELSFKLAQKLGLASYELPESVHSKLRYLRYLVLALLLAVFFVDSVLAERLAEVEPFKSTFLVPVWTRPWGYALWWTALALLAFVMYRPFCRYLCPLGAALALGSSFRPAGPKRRAFCQSCKICTRNCEPRAFRRDGSIDPRECLSCMECEATYHDEQRCPPLVGLAKLRTLPASPRTKERIEQLQAEAEDW